MMVRDKRGPCGLVQWILSNFAIWVDLELDRSGGPSVKMDN